MSTPKVPAPQGAAPPPATPALDALTPEAQAAIAPVLAGLFRVVPVREVRS